MSFPDDSILSTIPRSEHWHDSFGERPIDMSAVRRERSRIDPEILTLCPNHFSIPNRKDTSLLCIFCLYTFGGNAFDESIHHCRHSDTLNKTSS